MITTENNSKNWLLLLRCLQSGYLCGQQINQKKTHLGGFRNMSISSTDDQIDKGGMPQVPYLMSRSHMGTDRRFKGSTMIPWQCTDSPGNLHKCTSTQCSCFSVTIVVKCGKRQHLVRQQSLPSSLEQTEKSRDRIHQSTNYF